MKRDGACHLPPRGRPTGFALTLAIFVLFLAASGAPTPLYARYAQFWSLSAGALTVAFGVYAIALLTALLLFGDLSDAVGRRPVIVGALVVLVAGLLLFLVADGYVWLLAARALSGVAAGLMTAAASAALIDLEPSARPGLATLANVTGAMGGQAAGVLGSALLVQFAPRPTTLVFDVLVGLAAVLGAGYLLGVEETVRGRTPFRVRLSLGVPPPALAAFVAALPCLIATWSLSSLYLSLGPDIDATLLKDEGALASVSAPALLLLAGCASAIGLRHRPPRDRMLLGSGLLALGSALTALGLGTRDVPVFYASIAVAGLGFGVAFSGALQSLISLADDDSRAELVATVYLVAYLSFSVPAVIAGFASAPLGLLTTGVIFSGVIAALCLVSLLATWQRKPAQESPA